MFEINPQTRAYLKELGKAALCIGAIVVLRQAVSSGLDRVLAE